MYLSDEEYQVIKQALDDAESMQIKYSDALKLIEEQNVFLYETIEKQGLGKIAAERRSLQEQLITLQNESTDAIKKTSTIKSEYEAKLDKITTLIKDDKSKQSDIDAYIDSEAESKVADAKADYIKHKRTNDKALARHIDENDALLQEQLNKYKQQHKIIIICGVISTVIGVLGIVF